MARIHPYLQWIGVVVVEKVCPAVNDSNSRKLSAMRYRVVCTLSTSHIQRAEHVVSGAHLRPPVRYKARAQNRPKLPAATWRTLTLDRRCKAMRWGAMNF